jgi:hypothetical protein
MSEYGANCRSDTAAPGQFVKTSDGNRQKVILARSLAENCRFCCWPSRRGVMLGETGNLPDRCW